MDELDKIKELENYINNKIYGREKIVKAIMLSLVSGENVLIIGKHGEAKSMITHLISKHTNLKTFYKQIHQQTTLNDIIGVINPIEFKNGKLDLIKTKFWNSNIQFYDEFLRNSELVDFLMEIMVERICSKSVLGEVELKDLISVIATSNPTTEEYHTEKLDVALLDRFGFIVSMNHLVEDNYDSFNKVIRELDLNNNENDVHVDFSIEELKRLKDEVKKVAISDGVYKVMNNFSTLCLEKNVDLSTRLMLKVKNATKTVAFYNKRSVANVEDFETAIELVFSNRIDKQTYLEITEKLFNVEEYELTQKIIKLEKDMTMEKILVFLDYYIKHSEKYLFFKKETKEKLNSIFNQITNMGKIEFSSRDKDNKIELVKQFINFRHIPELKELFDNFSSISMETKFLDKTEENKLMKKLSTIKVALIVRKENYQSKNKLIIGISELSRQQLKEFSKLYDYLEKNELFSMF